MNGPALLAFLAAAAPAAAPAEPPAYLQFLPLVAMAAIFYFLILRPQMRRQKEQQGKIAALKKGDQVIVEGQLRVIPGAKVSVTGAKKKPGGAKGAMTSGRRRVPHAQDHEG
jgi:preprotein translocase YajC subunit